MIVMMNRDDRIRLGVQENAFIGLETVADDGIARKIHNLQVIDYDIPSGTCASYFPECNVLIPLSHHEKNAKTPAAKSIPVRVLGP